MKKVSVKCEDLELADRRFFEYINHQGELRTLYAQQRERERIRAARYAAKRRKMRRQRKWAQTRNIVIVALLEWFLFYAQNAELIDPVLSVPVMVLGFGFAVWCAADLFNIWKAERTEGKGRFSK